MSNDNQNENNISIEIKMLYILLYQMVQIDAQKFVDFC